MSCPYLEKEKTKHICWAAGSLLEHTNDDEHITDLKNLLDCYTIGSISPDIIAEKILHNNKYHGGETEPQLAYLKRLLENRNKVPTVRQTADNKCYVMNNYKVNPYIETVRAEVERISNLKQQHEEAKNRNDKEAIATLNRTYCRAMDDNARDARFHENFHSKIALTIHNKTKEKAMMNLALDDQLDTFKELYPAPSTNTLPILMPNSNESGELEDMFDIVWP